MALEFQKLPVKLKHLNIRKEGKDDEKVLACDVKLEVRLPADCLAYFDPALKSFMFREPGEVRFGAMGPIEWRGDMLHMELDLGQFHFRNVTLKKFEFTPIVVSGECFALTKFSASFKPEGSEIAILAEDMQNEVTASICPQPQLV